FVGDEEDPVLVAELAQFLPVAFWRNECSARVLDGLGEECGEGVSAFPFDELPDRLNRGQVGGGAPGRDLFPERVGYVEDTGHELAEGLLIGRDACHGEGTEGGAVVGHVPSNDLRAFRLSPGAV